MDEHTDVCLSPAAEAKAEARPSAVRQEHTVGVAGWSLSAAAKFNGIQWVFICVSMKL